MQFNFNTILRILSFRNIIVLYAFIQLLLYFQIGVFTQLEAEKYIREADSLLQTGSLTETKFYFYLPITLLIAFCKKIGLSLFFVVLVQSILFGIGLYYFNRLCKVLSNTTTANMTTLLLALFIPIHTWNFYLYSDSIFISLTLIYSYFVYTAFQHKKNTFIAVLLLLLLIFTRPNGILLVPPTIFYFLFYKKIPLSFTTKGLISFALLMGTSFIVYSIFKGGSDLDIMAPYINETVLCLIPEKTTNENLNLIYSGNTMNNFIYYISHNPMHFSKLLCLKLISFFNLTRPHYSFLHNTFMIVFMLPIYGLAIWRGILKRRTSHGFYKYAIGLFIIYTLGIIIQCDDWHSRFTMPLIPYIIFIAAQQFTKVTGIKKAL
jgi:hypothetical protein